MRKGISPLVSTVIMTAISIATITIVLGIGLPAIDRAKESLLLGEARNVLTTLDNTIRTVLYEGTGSARTINLAITGGDYFVFAGNDSIVFDMEQKSDIVERGIYRKEGNFYINTGADVNASDNSTHLILENPRVRVVIKKVGSPSALAAINTSQLIQLLRIKENSADIVPVDSTIYINGDSQTAAGSGYTQLLDSGSDLRRARIKAYIESSSGPIYNIYYTLFSNADFVFIEVKS